MQIFVDCTQYLNHLFTIYTIGNMYGDDCHANSPSQYASLLGTKFYLTLSIGPGFDQGAFYSSLKKKKGTIAALPSHTLKLAPNTKSACPDTSN